MARIPFTVLTAFVAVAEHRSFMKAVAKIGIALPTMSQTVRSLEEHLGVRLFIRKTRSVALAKAGGRLLAEVQSTLEGIDHAPRMLMRSAKSRSAHCLRSTSRHS